MKSPNQKKRRKTPLLIQRLELAYDFIYLALGKLPSILISAAKYFADKVVGFDFAKASSTISSTTLG
jgi:hypothetical protein